jgi:hypothetical protein
MKGRTRQAIIGFWERGEAGHFKHLNAAIAVTLRALYFEGLGQDEAVDLVIIDLQESNATFTRNVSGLVGQSA